MGLDDIDRRVLLTIIEKFDGGQLALAQLRHPLAKK
jgi:Holliday junction resolvasome RuvABC ATP-dependent DNA helicase subunit